MPGNGTNFEAPVYVGTRPQSTPTTPWINDYGPVQCLARGTLTAAGTATVSGTVYVPIGSVLIDVTEDTLTAWNGGTAVATVGTAAADATYAGNTDVHATGRTRPAFTATQLLNMGSVVAPAALVFSIAPGASSTLGATVFTFEYAPTQQTYIGNT